MPVRLLMRNATQNVSCHDCCTLYTSLVLRPRKVGANHQYGIFWDVLDGYQEEKERADVTTHTTVVLIVYRDAGFSFLGCTCVVLL